MRLALTFIGNMIGFTPLTVGKRELSVSILIVCFDTYLILQQIMHDCAFPSLPHRHHGPVAAPPFRFKMSMVRTGTRLSNTDYWMERIGIEYVFTELGGKCKASGRYLAGTFQDVGSDLSKCDAHMLAHLRSLFGECVDRPGPP